ncbi:unnamed protein product, partial [Mesorhabditis belari]|uniref:VWFA domain-containing protein n=1 Tax=Mesorhabditis belari TaxID=2138241 RepID=A0AAF3EX83_9BILA
MFQKVILFLLFITHRRTLVESCQVLFVIDGSSYYSSFQAELTAVTTTATILYSTNGIGFSANYWLYGAGDTDQPIPNNFLRSKDDFVDGVRDLRASRGNETIVGATNKLIEWTTSDALIVLYTASPQALVTAAGKNYTFQGKTIVLHINDGIDVSSLSNYPSPSIFDYGMLTGLIQSTCLLLEGSSSTTSSQSTTEAFFSTTPSPTPPECHAIFVIDGSSLVKRTRLKCLLGSRTTTRRFASQPTFGYVYNVVDPLASYDGNETLRGACSRLNDWPLPDNVTFVVLFTAGSQADVDSAKAVFLLRASTIGIPLIDGVDLSEIATQTADFHDYDSINDAIDYMCLNGMPKA